MKIFTLIASAALIASLSSCAKVHTCTCTTTDVGEPAEVTTATIVTGPKAMQDSKRTAKLKCEESEPANYNAMYLLTSTQTCVFD